MYLFFKVKEYFFALNAILVKRVDVSSQKLIEDERIIFEGTTYEIFEGGNFFKLTKGIEGQKKNLMFINSKNGYNYGVIVDTVEGFFDIGKISVINKTSLLNKYGYQYIDFAINIEDKLVLVFFDDFFDERYKELTCQR